MLPKPEKIKRIKASEQLDLVETISEADKLKHKRRWLLIALSITIGLSLVFWLYRLAKNIIKNPPSFPSQISLPVSSANLDSQLDAEISSRLSSLPAGWSVSVDSNQKLFNWSRNTVNLTEQETSPMINKLLESNEKPDSNISSLLPEGVSLSQHLDSTKLPITYQLLVSVPDHQILFVITSPQDFDSALPVISKLVSSLYWLVIQI